MSDLVIARYEVTDVTAVARGDDTEWAVTLTRTAPTPVNRSSASPPSTG